LPYKACAAAASAPMTMMTAREVPAASFC